MKKLLLSFVLCIPFAVMGQSSVYHPFPEDSVVWREDCDGLGFACNCTCTGGICVSETNRQYYYGNDTVINSVVYHTLFMDEFNMEYWTGPFTCTPGCIPSPNFYSNTNHYAGAIRDDAGQKKVYFYPSSSTGEVVLYDYDLQVGDTLDLTYTNIIPINKVSKIDSVLVGTEYHKRFWLWDINAPAPGPLDTGYVALIEGIGSTFGLLNPLVPPFEFICYINCVSIDSITVYPPGATDCHFMTSGLPPISNPDQSIVISPNPMNETTSVSWGPIANEVEVLIYNLHGQVVFEQSFTQADHADLKLSELATGMYTVTVNIDGKNVATLKLVKSE